MFEKRKAAFAWAMAGTALASLSSPVLAQTAAADSAGLDDIIVTAQKRSENLQDVPISVQAFGTKKIEQLGIANFQDYAKLLPSVSFQSAAPGYTTVYMRGIASGGDGNHSGPLPSVGVYLDEQPVTTIGGALDVHIYDIERIEALAGPQGTLYGASSQAGTLRIITNKPQIGVLKSGWDIEGNFVAKGSVGGKAEGFVNIPLGSNAAARITAFYKRDAGFIDNVPGTLRFPTSGITINNNALVKKNANTNDTYGGRAALKIDLDDEWEITPTIMGQESRQSGNFAYDPTVGDLQVKRFYPDYSKDRWYQAALTVKGKIGNFDLTYAGAYMERKRDTLVDYSDYSFFYDTIYFQDPSFNFGDYYRNNAGQLINPSQITKGRDRYSKMSHELRIASPSDQRLRGQIGAYIARQTHNIRQEYNVVDIADALKVSGTANSVWLTQQYRVDRDQALFGELTFDITDNLTLSGGIRGYKFNNTLVGFFGYGPNSPFGSSGQGQCAGRPAVVEGSPCTNLSASTTDLSPKQSKDSGTTQRVNLQWKPVEDVMLYGTYSTGFRPGGVNRRGTLPPYGADTLKNFEFGWKTQFADNAVRWNGAVFFQKWNNFQFSFLGQNGLTVIANAAKARVNGVETDLSWAVGNGFTLSGAAAYIDAKLADNYCGTLNADGSPQTNCATPQAPKGTRLPVTSEYKFNVNGRYEFDLMGGTGHAMAGVAYQSDATSDLRVLQNGIIGNRGAYTTVDVALGWKNEGWSAELFARNLFDSRGDATRYTACAPTTCSRVYVVPIQPLTVGIRVGQRF
ncbi:TonB-dependent receptor [Sandaracinobacteroides saxicola]|uniref:TonB-dependent receptor n=1 Tax=Sandaracinobacteroides saxicola TaxID=2759707 RepID=A0A7G5IH47_9SPHN|nr:TonB-dependent receptor [Sandaracinobacteroides saxicola]QMW22689.1 TonB-dependent receptor [Sandaracinobacteroides saxicola]